MLECQKFSGKRQEFPENIADTPNEQGDNDVFDGMLGRIPMQDRSLHGGLVHDVVEQTRRNRGEDERRVEGPRKFGLAGLRHGVRLWGGRIPGSAVANQAPDV